MHPMLGTYPKKRWRTRYVLFSESDVDSLTAALKSQYPRLRILKYHYWTVQDLRSPAAMPTIPYRDTLSSAERPIDFLQRAWLEPEGWEPVWSEPDDSGHRRILNPPPLAFTWDRPDLLGGSWFHEKGDWRLYQGRVTAQFVEGDREHQAFINKVCTTVARLSTNKMPLHYHDSDNGEIRGPNVHSDLWIGHGALSWVREDPRRCFFYCHRPSDSIEACPTPGAGRDTTAGAV